MKVKVRKAHRSDSQSIKAIEVAASLAPWNVEDYAAEASREGSVFLVAEDHETGNVLGFLLMRLITKHNALLNPKNTEITGDLLNLAISRQHRQVGIGTALLRTAIRQIPNSDTWTILLEVRASNSAAIAFYKRFGFRKTGFRRNFYSNPLEDALLMTLCKDKMLATNPPDEVVFEV